MDHASTPPQPPTDRTAPAAFALAAGLPAVLLALGVAFGPAWFLLALVWMVVLTAVLDRITAAPAGQPRAAEPPETTEFPASDALLVALGLAHLALLPLAVGVVADPATPGPARGVAFLAFGLFFGQISNPAAHELIHRGPRLLRALGVILFITVLFGHHASAHRQVHHRHVATPEDPNTARRGESFYRFALRAWTGSFRAGLAAASAQRRGGPHPYAVYLGGAAACLGLALALAGLPGLAAYAALALYATLQLLLSDYVQHYGLIRQTLPGGQREPVGASHSWNAPHRFSGAMLLHAPRHSDHHAHPLRAYPALCLPPGAPVLPHGLPVMGALALWPRRWRGLMHPRLDALAARSRERDSAGAGADRGDLAG